MRRASMLRYTMHMSEGDAIPIPEQPAAPPPEVRPVEVAPAADTPPAPMEVQEVALTKDRPLQEGDGGTSEQMPPVVEPGVPVATVSAAAAVPATPPAASTVPVSPPTAIPTAMPSPVVPPHFGHYSIAQAQEMSRQRRDVIFRDREGKILAYVAAHGGITKDATARLLYVSGNSAYLYLKRMVKEGKLRRVGRSKATRYVV